MDEMPTYLFLFLNISFYSSYPLTLALDRLNTDENVVKAEAEHED